MAVTAYVVTRCDGSHYLTTTSPWLAFVHADAIGGTWKEIAIVT